MSDYAEFLARKALKAPMRGLRRAPGLASHLFPFQAHTTDFALRAGASGAFLDTGLGKTETDAETGAHSPWCAQHRRITHVTTKPRVVEYVPSRGVG